MQLLHLKYYLLNHPTGKNDWVLCYEEVQELLTKKTNHKILFESFPSSSKEKTPTKKCKHNKQND